MWSERENHINLIASLERSIEKRSNVDKGMESSEVEAKPKSVIRSRRTDIVHNKQGSKREFYTNANGNKELEVARIALAQKLGYSL